MVFSKKGGAEDKPMTILIPIILALVFLVAIIGFISGSELFTVEYWDEFGCWTTNGLKCGGGLAYYLPSSCVLTIEEEAVSNETLAEMLKDAWWMYHKNKCDYGAAFDETYLIYAFSVEEDYKIEDFLSYLINHNDGKEVDSIVYSDFNKIEEGSDTFTLCFDRIYSKTIESNELKKGEDYYILFFDDQGNDYGDKLVITENPDLSAGTIDTGITNTLNDISYLENQYMAAPEYDGKSRTAPWGLLVLLTMVGDSPSYDYTGMCYVYSPTILYNADY